MTPQSHKISLQDWFNAQKTNFVHACPPISPIYTFLKFWMKAHNKTIILSIFLSTENCSIAIFEFFKVELLSKDSVLSNCISSKSITIWTFYDKWAYVLKYISYMNWFGFKSFFQARIIHFVLCSKYTMFEHCYDSTENVKGIPIVQGP